MSIGSKLQELINLRGMTVNDVAKKVNIPPSTLYKMITRGSNKADIDMLIILADYLNVPVEYFGSRKSKNFSFNIEEITLVAKYRQLLTTHKDVINMMINGFLQQYEIEAKKDEKALG